MTCDDGWKGAKCDQPCGDGKYGHSHGTGECGQSCKDKAPANCDKTKPVTCEPILGGTSTCTCK